MLLAVGEHLLGYLEPQCATMATGFAGGVGDTRQEMCGALSGGTLVIGMLFGRSDVATDDKLAIDLTARYRERFLAELGDTQCARLHEMVHASGGMGSCAVLVERAAMILMHVLDQGQKSGGPNGE
jgi:C_GCAxxG_C_C family probable redox protein